MSLQKDKCPDCVNGKIYIDITPWKANEEDCPTCHGEKKLDRPEFNNALEADAHNWDAREIQKDRLREKIAWEVYPEYDNWEAGLKFADRVIAPIEPPSECNQLCCDFIASEAKKQERERIIAWGEEDCNCPTNSLAQTDRNRPIRKRKTCWKCWQALREE